MQRRTTILLVCCAAVVLTGWLASSMSAGANRIFQGQDLQNMQDFLLNREISDLSGEDYDTNGDGIWSGLDLGQARQQMTTTASAGTLDPIIQEIPANYSAPAMQQGTLEELNYTTYESMTYEEHRQELEKRAIVYLPYGYTETQKYNILYLMHGGWSDETTTLGTVGTPSAPVTS